MDKGCKSIKHGKSKYSTPLRNIINKDRIFKAQVFNPFIKPVNFNRFNRYENKKSALQIHLMVSILMMPVTKQAIPEIDKAPCKMQFVLFQSNSIDQVFFMYLIKIKKTQTR